jgi:hypothetical protein
MLAVAALAVGTGAVVGVGSASAASLVSEATAQALNVNVLNVVQASASNPPTSATNDGTDPNSPVTVTPTVPVLSGISGLGVGALAEQTEANQDGSSFACAGVVQPGGAIQVSPNTASCTATGGLGSGVTLDLGSLPGVGSVLSAVADVTLTLNSITALASQDGSSAPTLNADFAGGSVTVTLLNGLLPTVTIPLTIGSGVDANLLTTIANAISSNNVLLGGVANVVSGALSDVLDLQTNFQPAEVDGTSSVTALHVGLLGVAGAPASTIDLATATVGPNVVPVPAAATNNVPAIATNKLSPTSGPVAGGTTVTITGSGFTGATAVDFGSTPATGFTVNSSTQINAISPAHAAGEASVTVVGPGGTSNGETFAYFAVPTIATTNGLDPTSGPVAGGTTVTITGTNFGAGSTVDFGTTPATGVTVVSPTQITATDPAGTAGATNVTVTTPDGTSNPVTYTYETISVALNSISPTSGPALANNSITLDGSGFAAGGNATTVMFGTQAAVNFTVVSDTQITAIVPAAAAGPVNVAVVTLSGTSNPQTYNYMDVP